MKDKLYNLFRLIGEYSLYGLLFFIPTSITMIEIFAVIMLVGFIGRKIIDPDFKFLKFQPNIFILLFLFFTALSVLNSGQYLNKSIHALFWKWLQYLGVFMIAQDKIYDQRVVKRGIFVFLSSALIVSLSGLSQYFFGIEFLRNNAAIAMDSGMRAITSSFVHYNSLGGYLVVVLSLVVALLLADNSFSIKTVGLLIFSVFSTVAIIFTFSRGGWLAAIASFIFMYIFIRKHLGRIILFFLAAIAIASLANLAPVAEISSNNAKPVIRATYPDPANIGLRDTIEKKINVASLFRERALLTFKSGGDSDRFKYWLAAFRMIKNHPFFGMGVGTFMANFPKYTPVIGLRVSYAHNCFLQIWAETGIFSVLSFLGFILTLIYRGISNFKKHGDFIVLGLTCAIFGFTTHSLFDTHFYSLQLAILFWTLGGVLAASINRYGEKI